MKIRIVQYIQDTGSKSPRISYVIEVKRFFGYRQINKKELITKEMTFQSYDEAETYMIKNYMANGICKRIGNLYHYVEYSYSYY